MRTRGDRRGRVRYEVIGQLWATLELDEAAPVIDIGKSGALLESAVPLAPDTRHALQLTVRGHVVTVDARVRHMRSEEPQGASPKFLVGVEFLNVPAVVANTIEPDDATT